MRSKKSTKRISRYAKHAGYTRTLNGRMDVVKFPFGKYKGCHIKDTESGYLEWFAENVKLQNRHKSLIKNIHVELKARIPKACKLRKKRIGAVNS